MINFLIWHEDYFQHMRITITSTEIHELQAVTLYSRFSYHRVLLTSVIRSFNESYRKQNQAFILLQTCRTLCSANYNLLGGHLTSTAKILVHQE